MGSSIKLARALRDLKRIKDIQGADGNWNYSPYMMGMFNGIELAMAIMQDREPVYKEQPESYLDEKDCNEPPREVTMPQRLNDLTGKKFGLLTVLSRAEDTYDSCGTQRVQWNCECVCGAKVIKIARYLLRGGTRSCGFIECKKKLKAFDDEYAQKKEGIGE